MLEVFSSQVMFGFCFNTSIVRYTETMRSGLRTCNGSPTENTVRAGFGQLAIPRVCARPRLQQMASPVHRSIASRDIRYQAKWSFNGDDDVNRLIMKINKMFKMEDYY